MRHAVSRAIYPSIGKLQDIRGDDDDGKDDDDDDADAPACDEQVAPKRDMQRRLQHSMSRHFS